MADSGLMAVMKLSMASERVSHSACALPALNGIGPLPRGIPILRSAVARVRDRAWQASLTVLALS